MATVDLVLRNATVLTLDPRRPMASMVAVHNGRIAAVGGKDLLTEMVGPETRIIDCQNGVLIPGFHDAHCHILGLAAQRFAVDCSYPPVDSIARLQQVLKHRARQVPRGQWIRAFGYHESDLEEHRHPTSYDLDSVTPFHPIMLAHRSGHAHVLNTKGLQELGITHKTPDPIGSVIDRNCKGELTGLLLEMGGILSRKIPPLGEQELIASLRQVNQELLSLGITSLQDATESNDIARWEFFLKLTKDNILRPHVTLMPGLSSLHEFHLNGLSYATSTGSVNLGPAKAILTLTTGNLHPSSEELTSQISQAQGWGFPVALHAVEEESITEAITLLRTLRHDRKKQKLRNRIEHCAECPPSILSSLQETGACLVTQPSFVYSNGDRYLREVAPPLQPWLYPLASMTRVTPCLAAGSDSPVGPINPLLGVYSAITRRPKGGALLNASQSISALEALALYSRNAAYVIGHEQTVGTITPGKRADFALLNGNPACLPPEALLEMKIDLTMVNGQIVWEM